MDMISQVDTQTDVYIPGAGCTMKQDRWAQDTGGQRYAHTE